MTADIASQLYCDEVEAKHRDLATRNLLGGCASLPLASPRPTKEVLHLDLRSWESPLLSGEVYQKKSSSNPIVHDLNLPPPQPAVDQNLLLLLLLSPSAPPPRSDHQCTIEKVRSALERAGRVSISRRSTPVDCSPSTTSSSSSASSSSKRRAEEEEEEEATRDGPDPSAGSLVAGCSMCSMYVLVSSSNPRCPRCDSRVPVPPAMVKKPRMEYMDTTDLNLTSPGNSH